MSFLDGYTPLWQIILGFLGLILAIAILVRNYRKTKIDTSSNESANTAKYLSDKSIERIARNVVKNELISQRVETKFILAKLQKSSDVLEATNELEELQRAKDQLLLYLEWFIDAETNHDKYIKLEGGATNMVGKVKFRYNEMILRISNSSLNQYKEGMKKLLTEDEKTKATETALLYNERLRDGLDLESSNYDVCFQSLDEVHYIIEGIFSDSLS